MAFVLGALAFMTLFSVEITSWKLKGTISSTSELKIEQEELIDYQYANHSDIKKDISDADNIQNNIDNNITTALHHETIINDTTKFDELQLPLQQQISFGKIDNKFPAHEINQAVIKHVDKFQEQLRAKLLPPSPACFPHFNHYQPNGQWNNTTKFKRILFYHARKAGGSSMNKYLVKVAQTYGIQIEWIEWATMEDPGTRYDKADTFYVTHMREPVDRAISHFKYNGRWPCKQLVNHSFVPTEDNAAQLETWNQTMGHEPKEKCSSREQVFRLGDCAVNCYTQWFGGLNCARWQVPFGLQYKMAMSKLLKYNLIIVIEKLRDPVYVKAIEDFFGVEGILKRGSPYCERNAHRANKNIPLVVHNETRAKLGGLNSLDLKLYHEISDCPAGEHIPKWDPSRFELDSFNFTQDKIDKMRAKAAKEMKERNEG